MEPIPKSGLYYPNKISRIALKAIEDVMGKNGLNAILNLAGLSHLIDNYPPDNLERQFDFADFSGINGALEEMYGPRGGRGLALRAGRATFAEGLRNFGALAGAGDLAFKVLPLSAKLHIGVPAMAKIFSTTSDQLSTVVDKGDHFVYTIHKCPVCWGRAVDKPACFMATGLLQEGLKWLSGGREFKVVQFTCHAAGDEVCDFQILKEPIA
ncbi:MAG: 4-vinyl reductase [Chloroflexi bacterium]|nr:MAG: 4-vinyl reductase [Chloroflexota bacterium]